MARRIMLQLLRGAEQHRFVLQTVARTHFDNFNFGHLQS